MKVQTSNLATLMERTSCCFCCLPQLLLTARTTKGHMSRRVLNKEDNKGRRHWNSH